MSDLYQLLANHPRLAKASQERVGIAEIASMLLQLRQVTGLTQADLAKKSGVTKSLISELENAANDGVSLRTLVKIAKGAGAALEVRMSLSSPNAGAVTTCLDATNITRVLDTPVNLVATTRKSSDSLAA